MNIDYNRKWFKVNLISIPINVRNLKQMLD
jgi:hypothetical protein